MHLSKNFKGVVCAVAAVAISFSTAAAAGTGRVTASDVNLRQGASLSAPVISTVGRGQTVDVINLASDWYEVKVNGVNGYISSKYVELESSSSANTASETKYVVVTASCVRFRKGPSVSDEIINEVGIGTKFEVLGEADGWTHLKSEKYGEGYIKSDYLRSYDPDATDSEIASELINYAMEHLGITYRYGGKSTSGFDCSGFVCYVYEHFGYSLCRVAADQYENDGEYVAREDLQPGDLLFFTYGSGVGHVGIYLGNGEFIHSSSSTEYCVTISSLENTVYDRRYCGAKRIL